jgi:hypothetical protein|tara:strand:- start:86 stop:232 length:147 start_codon:yes stop_codon:yes gene_type:complete
MNGDIVGVGDESSSSPRASLTTHGRFDTPNRWCPTWGATILFLLPRIF